MRNDVYCEVYEDKAGKWRWRLKQEMGEGKDTDTKCSSDDLFNSSEKAVKAVRSLLPGRLEVFVLG